MPSQNTEQALWFAGHLQPHEAMLRAWLKRRFSSACDIDDIIQEAYLRVLQARETGTLQSPKAFLFATARNFALNRLRDQRLDRTAPFQAIEALPALDTGEDIPEALARTQELELLREAIQSLPTRCRQILTLRRIYGMSQKDVAAELGIAEHTVEAQGTIGLRKIAEFFDRRERHPAI